MNSCERVRLLLPLSAGGDLGAEDSRSVRDHLAACESCHSEAIELSQVISMARGQFEGDYSLPDVVRRRVAREAAERAARSSWPVSVTYLPMPLRPGLLATAAACLVALVAVPFVLRDRLAVSRSGGAEITRIEVVSEGGEVRLAWSDGVKGSYTVYKSHDPGEISRGEAHVVHGNVWTDSRSDSSPIVFYRVE